MCVDVVDAAPRSVALYYPNMLPPTPWLRHALLFHDSASSIVHPDLLQELRTPHREATFGTRAAELDWLRREALWEPIDAYIREQGPYQQDLKATLGASVDFPEYKFEGGYFPPPAEQSSLYIGKLGADVERYLLQEKWAKLGRFGGHVMLHREVLAALLAVTAKHIAAGSRDTSARFVPGTDDPSRFSQAFGDLGDQAGRYQCIELLLSGIAPVPSENTSFDDVIRFRSRHRDELMAFQSQVDQLLVAVRTSEDPVDAVRAARREMELAVGDLSRAASARRFVVGAGTLTLITTGAWLSQMPQETVSLAVDGFGVAAATAIIGKMVSRPAVRRAGTYGYLLRVREAFGQ
jgi:hypothetical protein